MLEKVVYEKYIHSIMTDADITIDLERERNYLIDRLISLKDCTVCMYVNGCNGKYDNCFLPIEHEELLIKRIEEQ